MRRAVLRGVMKAASVRDIPAASDYP